MPGAFQYRPKFVDIRVRPPAQEEDLRAEDVHALKPGERACDHPGCRRAATARAPKSRDMLNEHYWFCQPHAAEYNRNWNFFAGLSEDEIRRRQEDELKTGGRPTWEMKAGRMSRESAAFVHKFAKGQGGSQGGYRDYHDLFGPNARRGPAPEPEDRRLGKIERNALADLDLDAGADSAKIRTRYTELVRRLHPDANQGDRSGEQKLQRVIKAYQALRKAGMV
ncbi:dnaJ-class molecular chaperone [Phenylobacterium zucineum HLK1]|uniref:DnaJ-class molecular chaperone n=1 Tax=Phenylobacterium zucineum (strain HLK1) TaxID=450851 RepID=B4RFR9_PHEZH|nr:J domain-containing protein [Phenylobacterium zucineum]ACG77150.1 dnaJ-class molecular chaperone [Phenylobacterium zucineum HLK1]